MKFLLRKNIMKNLLVKEFKQVFRDKRMTIVLFVQPVVMLFLLGYAANMDVAKVKIAVLDEDKTSESRMFVQKFIASNYFVYYKSLNSEKEVSPLLDKGEIDIYMHIVKNFSKNIKSGKNTNIQLIVDGTDSNRAAVVISYVEMITNNYSIEYFKDKIRMLILSRDSTGYRLKETINVEERSLFNPELKSRNFFLPGIIGLLLSLVTIMLTAMAVVKEKENGTIEQIIVSPIRPSEYILGKTLPFAIIAFVDIILITFAAILWFGVPFEGSFLFLLFSGLVYILSSLPIGLYISTISKTQQEAMMSTFLYFMPSMLFSGFVFPIYSMPDVIQILTYLNPLRYFITIIRGVFLKGIGIPVLWPEIIILFFIGTILIILSVRRFARRME